MVAKELERVDAEGLRPALKIVTVAVLYPVRQQNLALLPDRVLVQDLDLDPGLVQDRDRVHGQDRDHDHVRLADRNRDLGQSLVRVQIRDQNLAPIRVQNPIRNRDRNRVLFLDRNPVRPAVPLDHQSPRALDLGRNLVRVRHLVQNQRNLVLATQIKCL